jgi:hypothetical protein
MEKRSCPFCGKAIATTVNRCPFCREATPQAAASFYSLSRSMQSRAYVRRGLLWALLAGVIYYFAGGHSPLTIPFEVPSFVNQYLVPMLFLGAVAMALYGTFLRMRG